MILLDTSVLSLALRRRQAPAAGMEGRTVSALVWMVMEDQPLAVPGIVAQELLSGVRAPDQVERLEEVLSGFPLVLADEDDHREAARLANRCRAAGIAAAAIDCLIAAQALRRCAELFTADGDFARIASCCSLRLVALEEPADRPPMSTEELRRRGELQQPTN